MFHFGKHLVLFFLNALTLLLFSSCASNPTGGTNFVLMSESEELRIGKEEYEKMLKSVPVYRDDKLQAYVDKIGQKLAKVSDRPDLNYTFTIIDSPDINAFALPGGYIFVNRGLISFLETEDQLAAVIGHEIGHVTARHAVRQQTAARAGKAASTVVGVASVLATGTSVLAETANLFGGALLSGYGRDMELEADELGAEYIFEAGYNPTAVLDVLGVLKNQEDFMKKVAQKQPAYHGLFATHPRNDTRLQQAVGKVAALDTGSIEAADQQDFRQSTQGVLIGPSAQNLSGTEGRNRYYQNVLGYTLIFPKDWGWSETTTTLQAHDPENLVSLEIYVQRLQQASNPRSFIETELMLTELTQTESLEQYGLKGWTGIDARDSTRHAVIFFNGRAFIFKASFNSQLSLSTTASSTPEASGSLKKADVATNISSTDLAAMMLESIRSFRPIARNEQVYANPLKLVWIQADGKMTYEMLGTRSRIPGFPVETLRLINGDYPNGEPQAGEWIKIAN
jgi:predicted Zn-dependent protease